MVIFSAPGLYSALELLDFGLVRTFDERKVLQLNLLNSGSVPIHISVSSPQQKVFVANTASLKSQKEYTNVNTDYSCQDDSVHLHL